jgi:hypothetical protein
VADSGGYWLNLAEAQKLTQTELIPGIVDEDIQRGPLLPLLPIDQRIGQLDTTWNRESTSPTASQTAIGSQLVWSDQVDYTQVTRGLVTAYRQTPLNHFVRDIYGSFQNYEAITLKGLEKSVWKQLNDQYIYGDVTYGTNEMDGLHAWATEATGDLDIDNASAALSLANLRALRDAMKLGIDFWLMPFQVARRIDAFFHGHSGNGVTQTLVGSYIWGEHQILGRLPFLDGVPIIRSDYLVAETADTGVGSNARTKNTTGSSENFTIFAVKGGQVREGEGGLTLGFGGRGMQNGEFFKSVYFDDLEDYDAAGLRVVSYYNMMAGSTYAVGRIYDITDAAIVA